MIITIKTQVPSLLPQQLGDDRQIGLGRNVPDSFGIYRSSCCDDDLIVLCVTTVRSFVMILNIKICLKESDREGFPFFDGIAVGNEVVFLVRGLVAEELAVRRLQGEAVTTFVFWLPFLPVTDFLAIGNDVTLLFSAQEAAVVGLERELGAVSFNGPFFPFFSGIAITNNVVFLVRGFSGNELAMVVLDVDRTPVPDNVPRFPFFGGITIGNDLEVLVFRFSTDELAVVGLEGTSTITIVMEGKGFPFLDGITIGNQRTIRLSG